MRLVARIFPLLLISFASYGQTIATYAGTAPTGVVNTPIMWSNSGGSGTATLLYNASAPTLTGAQYLTYRQGSVPTGVTTYTTTYTGNLTGATGSIQVMADDTATVSVNGKQIGTVPTYNTVSTIAIPSTVWINGTNKISVAVTNLTGNTGVAFVANLTPLAVAPTKPPTVVATYTITGTTTLTIMSNNTFTLSGTGIQATKK